MRSRRDRIRHAVGFEGIGLLLITGLGGWLFELDFQHFGLLAVILSTMAMIWNFHYNRLFDLWLLRRRASTIKRQRDRVLHALVFEGGLLVLTLPIIAWWLQMGVWQALVMDIAIAIFFLVYAYIYNLAYDWLFPLRQQEGAAVPGI